MDARGAGCCQCRDESGGPHELRGELINFLAQYDEDTPVYLSFDNGYTYGGITEGRFEEDYGEED